MKTNFVPIAKQQKCRCLCSTWFVTIFTLSSNFLLGVDLEIKSKKIKFKNFWSFYNLRAITTISANKKNQLCNHSFVCLVNRYCKILVGFPNGQLAAVYL